MHIQNVCGKAILMSLIPILVGALYDGVIGRLLQRHSLILVYDNSSVKHCGITSHRPQVHGLGQVTYRKSI